MITSSSLLRIGVAAGVIISFSSMSFAAQPFSIKKKTTLQKAGPAIAPLPDLSFLKKAQWSNLPKAGDTIGSAAILNISIKNKGIATSKPCKMQIGFKSITGKSSRPNLSGSLDIPLGPSKSPIPANIVSGFHRIWKCRRAAPPYLWSLKKALIRISGVETF